MEIQPIQTEADYKATLKEVSKLMESDPKLGTPEGLNSKRPRADDWAAQPCL